MTSYSKHSWQNILTFHTVNTTSQDEFSLKFGKVSKLAWHARKSSPESHGHHLRAKTAGQHTKSLGVTCMAVESFSCVFTPRWLFNRKHIPRGEIWLKDCSQNVLPSLYVGSENDKVSSLLCVCKYEAFLLFLYALRKQTVSFSTGPSIQNVQS